MNPAARKAYFAKLNALKKMGAQTQPSSEPIKPSAPLPDLTKQQAVEPFKPIDSSLPKLPSVSKFPKLKKIKF